MENSGLCSAGSVTINRHKRSYGSLAKVTDSQVDMGSSQYTGDQSITPVHNEPQHGCSSTDMKSTDTYQKSMEVAAQITNHRLMRTIQTTKLAHKAFIIPLLSTRHGCGLTSVVIQQWASARYRWSVMARNVYC